MRIVAQASLASSRPYRLCQSDRAASRIFRWLRCIVSCSAAIMSRVGTRLPVGANVSNETVIFLLFSRKQADL